MKSQKIKAVVISTLLVGLVAIASCSRHENRYRPDNHNLTTHVERISRELDLNQDQVEQLEALISNFEEKRTAIERGHAILDDIGQQLAAEQFDEKYAANSISNFLEERNSRIRRSEQTSLVLFHTKFPFHYVMEGAPVSDPLSRISIRSRDTFVIHLLF